MNRRNYEMVLKTSAGALLTAMGSVSAAQDASPPPEAARLVAAQASVEWSVWSGVAMPDFSPADVEFERLNELRSTVPFWRGLVRTLSHSHPYIIAVINGRVVGIGGFASPALREASSVARIPFSRENARSLAYFLAVVADPNGALSVVPPSAEGEAEAATSGLLNSWKSHRPPGWPEDTVQMLPDSTVRVRITVLSSMAWTGFRNVWLPIGYAFDFTPDGQLLHWAFREGDQFANR